jgi:hypothetical protein
MASILKRNVANCEDFAANVHATGGSLATCLDRAHDNGDAMLSSTTDAKVERGGRTILIYYLQFDRKAPTLCASHVVS